MKSIFLCYNKIKAKVLFLLKCQVFSFVEVLSLFCFIQKGGLKLVHSAELFRHHTVEEFGKTCISDIACNKFTLKITRVHMVGIMLMSLVRPTVFCRDCRYLQVTVLSLFEEYHSKKLIINNKLIIQNQYFNS